MCKHVFFLSWYRTYQADQLSYQGLQAVLGVPVAREDQAFPSARLAQEVLPGLQGHQVLVVQAVAEEEVGQELGVWSKGYSRYQNILVSSKMDSCSHKGKLHV